jgi:uncharacterized protein YbaR (Trm112 family)
MWHPDWRAGIHCQLARSGTALFLYRHEPYNTVNRIRRMLSLAGDLRIVIDKQLLSILVCPESRIPLELADETLLAAVNQAIAGGRVKNHGGESVTEPFEAALVRQDRAVIYPIIDRIPILLADAAIAWDERTARAL